MRFVGLALALVAVGAAAVALAVGLSARNRADDARRDTGRARAELVQVRKQLVRLSKSGDDRLRECLPEVVSNLDSLESYLQYGGGLRLTNYSRDCSRLIYGPPQG